jgi:AcrR family transcriptional regulator
VQVPAVSSAPGRVRRNDALSAVRREAILEAAIRLFGRKGFAATRAEDIAAAAQLAKGTVYLYFRNKEAIYTAAVAQAVRELQAEIARRSAPGGSLEEKLATAIRVRLEFWPEHEAIYRLLLTVGREPRLRRQTNDVIRAAQESFLAILNEGAASGEIPARDFAPLGWAALDMIRGATERRMDKLTRTTPQQDAAFILGMLLRELGAPPPPAA